MTAVVPLAPVRRWVRARQNAAHNGGSTLGNLYFGALLVVVTGGIFWPTVRLVFWPVAPTGGLLTAVGIPLLCAGALLLGLRGLGPLAVSRPAASWLLTAPVSRRGLLAPSAGTIVAVGVTLGAAGAFVGISQGAVRPVTVGPVLLTVLGGALAGIVVVLAATVAQRRGGWARAADLLAYAAVTLGMAAMVTDRISAGPSLVLPAMEYADGLLAVITVLGAGLAYRGLDHTPNEAILASARTAGTVFDAAYVGQPSFVSDLVSRRYWAARRWRSRRFASRLPVLVAQDLRVLGRKGRRLAWLAVALLVPALVVQGSPWLLGTALVLGAMAAAGTTTGSVRTDAENPTLLRLLGISAREAVLAHAWLPTIVASLWSASAFGVLMALGALPAGPWWAVGLAIGPAVAAGAIRRARLGLVQNGLLPLDTPMGSLETGPLLAALIGYDLFVIWTLPTLVALLRSAPVTWSTVLYQAIAAGIGLAWYTRASTSTEAADLTAR